MTALGEILVRVDLLERMAAQVERLMKAHDKCGCADCVQARALMAEFALLSTSQPGDKETT